MRFKAVKTPLDLEQTIFVQLGVDCYNLVSMNHWIQSHHVLLVFYKENNIYVQRSDIDLETSY